MRPIQRYLLAIVLLLSLSLFASPVSQLAPMVGCGFVNNDFETATLAGWTVSSRSQPGSTGNWYNYTGTTSPQTGHTIAAPPQGTRGAVTDHNNPSTHVLYQDIAVPTGVSSTLSFYMAYNNNWPGFVTLASLDYPGNQQIRVDLMKTTAPNESVAAADVLLNLYQSQPGDPLVLPATLLTFDVSAFAGMTVRLRFAEAVGLNFFPFAVDNVCLSSSPTQTFTVTRSDDIPERGTCAAGDCTLREAVIAANNSPGKDTINFALGLNGVPITLTQTGANAAEDLADYGDLDVRESVNIVGNGSGNTIIQAGATPYGGIDKIFGLNPDCAALGAAAVVSLTDFTVRNGHNVGPIVGIEGNQNGGAIDFCSGGTVTNSLTMTNVIVRDSQSDLGPGGGLNVNGVGSGTTNINLTNVQFLNNKTIDVASASSGGGAKISLNQTAATVNVNITNSTFDNNEALNSSGGGLQITSNILTANTGTLNIHNSVFSNNRAKLSGGGIDLVGTSTTNGKIVATIDQETVFSGNVTGINSGTSFGGGIRIDLPHANSSALLSKVTVINNSESGSAVTNQGGGGIGVARAVGPVSIAFSRIANNIVSGAGEGGGLRKDNQSGTVTATNNWWGCSAGPGAAPCDTAVLVAGTGTLSTSPFLRIKTTPLPDTILVNQTSALTARMQDSNGVDTPVSNLDVFVNTNATAGSPLAVNWSAIGGSLSGQQATLQSSGGFAEATAVFTGTAASVSNSATAKVDNDTTSGNTNTGAITVNKSDTSLVINSDDPDPSPVGTAVAVNLTFGISNSPSSPTVPSGNFTIGDGIDTIGTCPATLGTSSCSISLNTPGNRTLTATYDGDSNFNGSSDTESHMVGGSDLTAVKSNNVAGTTTLGNSWVWTVRVANSGSVPATFTSGQVILSDNLPNTNVTYGSVSLSDLVNVTNSANINCSIVGDDLTCTASGGLVTIGATTGRFDVNFAVTPTPTQAAAGTIANPRSGGSCSADPGSTVAEDNEGNNTCSDSVVVTAPTPVFTDPAGACAGNIPCFTSIQTAINVVAAGGVVNVGAGTYAESPDLNRNATLNIDGDISIIGLTYSSGSINGLGATISLLGDWVNNGGVFNPGTGTVKFNGSSGAQTIGGTGNTIFNNLTIDNSSSAVNLSTDEAVNGLLTLSSDLSTVGPTVLVMPSTATSTGTGDVIGNVRRAGFVVGPSNTLSFGNPLNQITIDSGTPPTDILVNLVKTAPPGFTSAIQRTYTITTNGGSGFSATLRLRYVDGELNSNIESHLDLWRFDGANWLDEQQTTRHATENWVEKSGVTTFSPWTLATHVNQPPSVTNATTVVGAQTTAGLVVDRNAADVNEVTHFIISNIANGTLFKNDGTTQINNSDVITVAEGNAGLKFTPMPNSVAMGSFNAQSVFDVGGNGASTSATGTITVNKADTSVGLTSANNPSVFGQSVTFTATVSVTAPGAGSPSGTVQFLDGGNPIAGCTSVSVSGGQAQCLTSVLSVGNHTIIAQYSGDGNFNTSNGSMTGNPQVVNKADATVGLTSATNPSVFGQSVTFTATIAATPPGAGTPSGTMNFLDGGNPIAGCQSVAIAAAQAQCMTSALAVGNHTISAAYSGDGNFNTSTGNMTGNPQVVNKANTSVGLVSDTNPSVFGQPVTFTATVAVTAPGAGSPSGTVNFLDGGNPIVGCQNVLLQAGQSQCQPGSLSVGNHTITAQYSGDGSFNTSTGNMTGNPQVVNKADTSVGLTSSQNPAPLGTNITFTATISVTAPGAGTPSGTVAFLDGGNPIAGCTSVNVAAGQAQCMTSALTVGNHTITAQYSGDASFNTSTGLLTGNPQVITGPPLITPTVGLARVQGSPETNSQIAVVSDDVASPGSITVIAETVPAGMTINTIINTNGVITANIAAACGAATGANVIVLKATDGKTLSQTANLSINVTPNPAPTLGNYANTTIVVGCKAFITPDAPPADNVSVSSVTVLASGGFTGTPVVDPATGVVTITGSGPVGPHTITVTVTDNCSTTFQRMFTLTVVAPPTAPTEFDFDGDRKADISVYRTGATSNDPSYWYILRSSDNVFQPIQFGADSDVIVPGDYNGDGTTDVAIYRPGTQTWFTDTNPATNYGAFQWGVAGDIPVPGQYDADDKTDIAVFRPSDGNWYIAKSTGGIDVKHWGQADDKPVPADYDGDGTTDVAVWRPSDGFWYVQNSGGGFTSLGWGLTTDLLVPADYDGDGKDDIAVYRPSTGFWYIVQSSGVTRVEQWGQPGDIPAPADFDNDGKADLAVYRTSEGTWYIFNSCPCAPASSAFGISTDKPIPAAFTP